MILGAFLVYVAIANKLSVSTLIQLGDLQALNFELQPSKYAVLLATMHSAAHSDF